MSKDSKLYVCGPMSGLPGYNFETFKYAAQRLRALDYTVVCPTEISTPEDNKTWNQCLKDDLIQMLSCSTIVYLPGWQTSRGATLEMLIALALGYSFHEIAQINPTEELCRIRYDYKPSIRFLVSSFIRVHFGLKAGLDSLYGDG